MEIMLLKLQFKMDLDVRAYYLWLEDHEAGRPEEDPNTYHDRALAVYSRIVAYTPFNDLILQPEEKYNECNECVRKSNDRRDVYLGKLACSGCGGTVCSKCLLQLSACPYCGCLVTERFPMIQPSNADFD